MKGLLDSCDYGELRDIINYLGIAAFVIDVDDDGFRVVALNERHEQLTGMSHDQVAGRRIEDILSPETAERVKGSYRCCVRQRTATDYQEALELPAGKTYWRTTLVPYIDSTGRVFRLLGTSIEISSTVHQELESRYQSTLLNAYLDESPDGIVVVDADDRIKTWNRRFLEIWSIPDSVMSAGTGDSALEAVRAQLKNPDEFVDRIRDLYKHLDQEERSYRFQMLDGRIFERYSRGLHDDQGTYWGRIWFYRDITEDQRLTMKLQHLARTDMLTQTQNRRAFMETLAEEFRRAQRYRHPLTVLMIDMDHFKDVNDRYGHEGGDVALKVFANTVRPLLRETDHFARMGGEEFAILLPETVLEEGGRIAERIVAALADVTVECRRGSFRITASIGVASMWDGDAEGEDVLSRADRALYAAKAGGRNRVECESSPPMSESG